MDDPADEGHAVLALRRGVVHAVPAPGDEALVVLQLVQRLALIGAEVHLHQLRHIEGLVAGIEDVRGLAAAAQRGGVDLLHRRIVLVLDILLERVDALLAERVVAEPHIAALQVGAGDSVAEQVNLVG